MFWTTLKKCYDKEVMNRKRSKIILAALMVWLALWPCPAHADSFVTGKDWVQRMTPREKLMAVLAPMILLHRIGVPIRRSPEHYVVTIDRVVLVNPYLEKEDLANIFASSVYAYEPQTRPYLAAIDKISKARRTGQMLEI